VDSRFRQWAVLSAKAKELNQRANEIRDELLAFAEENGEEDARGHRVYQLSTEIATPDGKTYTGFVREKRVSRRIAEERAWEMAEEKGLLDQVFPVVERREFSEDGLYAAYQEDKITDDELDSLIDVSETYAFKGLS